MTQVDSTPYYRKPETDSISITSPSEEGFVDMKYYAILRLETPWLAQITRDAVSSTATTSIFNQSTREQVKVDSDHPLAHQSALEHIDRVRASVELDTSSTSKLEAVGSSPSKIDDDTPEEKIAGSTSPLPFTPWPELDPQVLLLSTDGVAYLLTQSAFDGAKQPFFTYSPEGRIEKATWEDSSILDVVVPYLANPDSVEPLKLNFPHTWEVIAFFEGWGVTRGIDAVRDAFSRDFSLRSLVSLSCRPHSKVPANDLKLNLYHSEDLNQLLDYAHRALSIHPGLSSAVDHLTAVFDAHQKRLINYLEASSDHVAALLARDFEGEPRTWHGCEPSGGSEGVRARCCGGRDEGDGGVC